MTAAHAWACGLILAFAPFGAAGQMTHEHAMTKSSGLEIPESRAGSGTAWQPDSTPMHAHHVQAGSWMLMLHGSLFVGYDDQGSDRGDSKPTAPSWVMLMETRGAGSGTLTFREMLSLDPWLVGKSGYPLLLQTGESLDGEPIHDRQHPHDLFMELAGLYAGSFSESLGFAAYLAAAGEPALGPVAFPHRVSAMSDPMAPLGHHWQDSTHISFGVVTLGLVAKQAKLEGSWFNGREPDEKRYDLELRTPDSYSGRVSFNPSRDWSLQVSYGFLASPESLHPEVSVHRITASASFNRPFGNAGNVAITAVFGHNDPSEGEPTSSWLLEANIDTEGRSTVFGRAEWIDKSGEDLALPPALATETFGITSYAAGYLYRLIATRSLTVGLGGRISINLISGDLEPFYGTRHPAGAMAFVNLHP